MRNANEFESVTSFEELYALIMTKEFIPGSIRVYTPGEMRLKIERVRHGRFMIQTITRTFGIRAAVERLLETDPVYHKYTKGSRVKKNRRP